MAVQIIEGIEGGGPQARIWTIDGGSGGAGIGAPGSGSWSRFAYNAGSSGGVARAMKNTSATEIWIAVRIFTTANNYNIFTVRHPDGNTIATLNRTAGGVCALVDLNSVNRGTGSTVIPLNTWNLYEVHLKVGDAATGQFELRLNGLSTNELSDTSAGDYKNGSNTTVGYIDFNDSVQNIDDLIVYDSTGSNWNTWVGDKVVVGLFPSGKGASEQWNPPVASAQRWYFPDWSANGVAVSTPANSIGYSTPVTVTPDALWDTIAYSNGVAFKGMLSPYRQGSPIIEKASGSTVPITTGTDVLLGQWISPGLAAQTITGNVHAQMYAREVSTANDMRSQLVIRVVSADGLTVRGTIYAGDTGSMTDEWPTAFQNVTFPQDAISPATLTNIGAITDGDRLVVEFGFRAHATNGTLDARVYVGDAGSSGDLPDSEADTTTALTYNPWIEFSNAITLSDNSNWEYVDEAKPNGPDDDGTYVETTTDNDIDFYAFENVPSAYTVSGPIAIKTQAKKVDPGTRTISHVYTTSGGTQTGAAIGLPTGSYAIQETLLDVDGTDSAVFNDTKVNAIQAGPKATT